MRKFMLVFALVLSAQAYACTKEKTGNSEAERGRAAYKANPEKYLSLISENVSVIFYANFDQMRRTELGQELQKSFRENAEIERDEEYLAFVEGTGIKLEEDTYEVWFGAIGNDEDVDAGGFIATGKFDEDRIKSYLQKERQHEVSTYKDHTIYISTDHHKRGELAFLGKQAVVAGDHEWVKGVIDRAVEGGSSVLDNKVMAKEIAAVEKTNHLWGVVDLSEKAPKWANDLKNKSSFRGTESLRKIHSITFFTRLDKKADVHIHGNFGTAEEAKLLAEAITGFKAMAKLMMADDHEAIDMLNEIKIDTDGRVLAISAEVDRSFFEKLKEKRETFTNGPVKLL